MKKLLSFAGAAIAAMLFFSCVPDKSVVVNAEFDEPALSVTPDTLDLGKSAGATVSALIESDQAKISAEVSYNYVSWMSAEIDGANLVVKAEKSNKTGVARQGSVRVVAGEKGVIKEINVIVRQEAGEPDVLELEKESVSFNETSGQTEKIAFTTNQSPVTGSQDTESESWLSFSIVADTIFVNTIAANDSENTRVGTITINAGETSKDITVSQTGLAPILEFSAESVALDMASGSSKEITYSTNQASVTVTVPSEAQSWLSASASQGVITFTSLSANSEFTARSADVTVKAGTLEKTVSVTQKGKSYVGMDYEEGGAKVGIIFWADSENPKHVMVISAKAEAIAWCKTKGAKNGIDSGNMTYVEANNLIRSMEDYAAGEYPAFKYCDDMGTGWYLPREEQMKYLAALYCGVASFDEVYVSGVAQDGPADQLQARKDFDARLISFTGGVALNTKGYDNNGDSCWLARESTEGKGCYYRWGKIGSMNNADKSGISRYARCIKEVTLP